MDVIARNSGLRRECPQHQTASLAYLDDGWRCLECGDVGVEVQYVEMRRDDFRGAVEALRRIAAGHAHPSKLAGEALDALPPDDNLYDPPYFERGQ